MTIKKANLAFLFVVLLNIGLVLLLSFVPTISGYLTSSFDGMEANFLLSEAIILIPLLFVILFGRGGEKVSDIFGFHKVKITTLLLVVVYTILLMPMTTLLNSISMLFVDNAILENSDEMLAIPGYRLFFYVAILAPFCEELLFRGLLYHSYRKSRNLVFAGLCSALLFGLYHMNFNQAPYAFALGVMMALLVEATGSIWSSFLMHFLINGFSVGTMITENMQTPGILEQAKEEAMTPESLVAMLPSLAIATVVGLAIALCLLVKMAEMQGRYRFLSVVMSTRKNHAENITTVPYVLTILICLAVAILETVVQYLYT